ncbi:UNKNOWN [Stylonychia lemnae]|uniref:Endonuclease/exonuclease/phosphatase domain-containing protein n=1 Tax=Stylonychia lemnae TaxID=5949 RepID=A0A078ALE9_STYLE|nr:UNKNOWN [Stylonychia lemnae]|eukprot:CDW83185.1 UNKNOWN [Stylonychia lemnae]
MNILAQHLIDGQCCSYRQVNDKKNPELLRNIRFEAIKTFVTQSDIQDFDILNIQEVGPLDQELMASVLDFLNEQDNKYAYTTSQKPTGAQQLKCATIHNNKKLQELNVDSLLIMKKEKVNQFGYFQTFRHREAQKLFVNCNLHLSGGKTEEDRLTRQTQLNLIRDHPIWKDNYPIILGGDMNTEIEELVKLVKEVREELQYIHTAETLYNSENRIQSRNRDGWNGTQVVQRTVDGLFFTGMNLLSVMRAVENFSDLINQDKISKVEDLLKEIETSQDTDKKNALNDECWNIIKGDELGFPSAIWYSDHVPIGAVFQL